MRGYIKKRAKGSYTIVLSLGKDESGKKRQHWETVKGNKVNAEKRLVELQQQLFQGTYVKPSPSTTGEFLEHWLSIYKPNLSPRSYERYRDIIRRHIIPCIGKVPLTQLKPEHLQKHYASIQDNGLSACTVRYHHAVIHVALKSALKWGIITHNPSDAVELPKTRTIEMKTWGEQDINTFLDSAKESTYYPLFYTALFTGMRRSELLGLKWGDIDFVMSQIYVSKGLHQLKTGEYIFTEPKSSKSRRTISMSPSTYLVLKEHYEKQSIERLIIGSKQSDDDLVFCTPDWKPLRPNSITRAWKTIAVKCGLPEIRLHDTRHTHASIMLKQGIHPKIVQERLGHSSIEITLDTYSHVVPGLQEAAAKRFDCLINSKEPAREELSAITD